LISFFTGRMDITASYRESNATRGNQFRLQNVIRGCG
jgi:hypothetical protein